MKKRTKETSTSIRRIALFVLVVGAVIAVTLLILGIVALSARKMLLSARAYQFSLEVVNNLRKLQNADGIGLIVLAFLSFWAHYVVYVLISAYATFIENSDRSDVVNAINRLNDTLSAALISYSAANAIGKVHEPAEEVASEVSNAEEGE